MTIARVTRISRTIPMLLIVVLFCPITYSKIIYVDDDEQADFNNIQAGIDAAEYGDTVCVEPGIYHENIVLINGIDLSGAGADMTIIDANGYGDVVDARANDVTISGFTLRNSGENDLGHGNCGVYLHGSYAPIVRDNVIVNNKFGIGVWDGANLDIRNNIIENNFIGIYLYGSEEKPSNPSIINNTILNNEIEGITLRVMVSPVIANNIITGHAYGINHNYVTGAPIIHHNNLWHNEVNYMRDNNADELLAGPGSISVDPYFAESSYWADINDPNIVVDPNDPNAIWIDGDYHLIPCSPCIDSGDPNYISEPNETDLDGNPRVIGGRIDMGAYEYPFVYDKPDEGSSPGSWWRYSENPVFSEGGHGEWDYRIKSISVLKDHEELVAKYKMWYVGGENEFFEGAGIGYATSTDGINWIRNENNPVLEPREPWNADGFSGICVIKDGPIYKLWYEGSDNENTARIGYATSSDGINWDINNSNPVFSPGGNDAWDNEDVGNPCVVKEGSTYKMWYWGDDHLTDIDQIGLAVSNDGINWQRVRSEPVIAPDPSIWWQDGEGIGTPHVLRFNSGYVMAYHAADQPGNIRIGLATSSDGLEWKKEHNPILDIGTDNSWESIGVITGSLIQDASHLKLWYLRIDSSEIIKVGLAISCDDIVFDIEGNN